MLVLLATRIPQLGLGGLLTAAAPAWEIPLGTLGTFAISPALVLSLRDIFGTAIGWSHQLLYVPSLFPFVLTSAASWWLLAAPAGTAKNVWHDSVERMRNPVLALLGALVFVHLLIIGGDRSAVMLIGHSLAAVAGGI